MGKNVLGCTVCNAVSLLAPCFYLNQCQLIISEFLWYHSKWWSYLFLIYTWKDIIKNYSRISYEPIPSYYLITNCPDKCFAYFSTCIQIRGAGLFWNNYQSLIFLVNSDLNMTSWLSIWQNTMSIFKWAAKFQYKKWDIFIFTFSHVSNNISWI